MDNIRNENAPLKMMRVKENAVIPRRQTKGSAGYDLCACIGAQLTIEPGEMVIITTGIAAEIPEGCAGMIFTRSGLGVKHGIAVANGVGVIDSDYRGEIHVGLRNTGKNPYTVSPGERVAQLILMEVYTPQIEVCEKLSSTERGDRGFGSTGK